MKILSTHILWMIRLYSLPSFQVGLLNRLLALNLYYWLRLYNALSFLIRCLSLHLHVHFEFYHITMSDVFEQFIFLSESVVRSFHYTLRFLEQHF